MKNFPMRWFSVKLKHSKESCSPSRNDQAFLIKVVEMGELPGRESFFCYFFDLLQSIRESNIVDPFELACLACLS